MSQYNIKTKAGQALWEQMNQESGSSVWGPVGKGIEAIEAEVEERIITLLQEEAVLCGRKGSKGFGLRCAFRIAQGGCNCKKVIALLKGESK